MTLTRFGTAPDGRAVQRIALAAGDLRLALLDRGAILQDLRLAGIDWPLTAGATDLAAYLGPLRWFGAIVGPVANRIGGARACIDGRPTRFVPNEGQTLLHSGAAGTHARHWQPVEIEAGRALLRLDLAAGIDGFPGNRRIEAEFVLDPPATLRLILTAVTDAPTLMNLANHSYWTLDPEPGIGGQELQIAADHWLPVEAGLPTGEIRPVSGAMDFRAGRPLGETEGIDHNFCLASAPRDLTEVVRLTGRSGVRLTLATTAPGLQVYTGREIDSGPFAGHGGRPLRAFDAIALEPQHWPDAPNRPEFPPITLAPGETFRQETRFSFSA
ncbi:galactose mutarotase [Cereibacter sphaeroides]|uniref:aldose epimerase family protein n=1 Tax=Cereibacter sphaeroides TaxID=1063 RepID=UPI000F51D0EB|nr:aldose epimerase family protein [Cereibacter sphaeroides]AZB65579.1 galactose mutarotase [Cereibacter sphaeroides]AZB70333.1 galactose mutarotase [Cereibacter sphaeroides]